MAEDARVERGVGDGRLELAQEERVRVVGGGLGGTSEGVGGYEQRGGADEATGEAVGKGLLRPADGANNSRFGCAPFGDAAVRVAAEWDGGETKATVPPRAGVTSSVPPTLTEVVDLVGDGAVEGNILLVSLFTYIFLPNIYPYH